MSEKQTHRQPKILIYDIETAPMLGNVWSLWENNVSLNQLEKDWNILSWAAKWLHDDYVYYDDQSQAKDIQNEKRMLKGLHKLIDEADIVVTHNGKRFDERKLNARFFHFGMKPLGKKRHLDTKQIASRHFAFTSNKLEYLTNKFCETKKLSHAKFPGFQLWSECLKGNQEAWAEMAEYNIADVESLEELFLKLLPWDDSINFNAYHDRAETFCSCGSSKFKKYGFTYTNSGKFQKFLCVKCGKYMRSKENLLSKQKRKSLKGRI